MAYIYIHTWHSGAIEGEDIYTHGTHTWHSGAIEGEDIYTHGIQIHTYMAYRYIHTWHSGAIEGEDVVAVTHAPDAGRGKQS